MSVVGTLRLPRPARAAMALGCVLPVCACGPDRRDVPAEPVVRDSAGIAIVENATGVAAAGWADVRAVPDLAIGADSTDSVQFGQIVGMEVHADGRIFVLDQVERAVRVFAPDGAALGSIGRPGEGPGEFSRYVNGLVLRGDTLLVPDWAGRRMNRFAPDGTLLGIDDLVPSGARTWWQAAGDGSLRARVLAMRVDESGRWTSDDLLVAVDEAAGTVDTLLAFDYVKTDIGGPQAVKAPLIINTPSWTVLPDGAIAWTALDLAEVRVHSPDGDRVRIIRSDAWRARDADDSDRTHLIGLLRQRLERLGGDPAAIAQLDIPPVGTLPVLTSVLAGPGGTLWVQRAGEPQTYHPMSINAAEFPHGLGGTTWDVLDATGALLGSIVLPDRIQVLHLRHDALYGVRRDELGVESVVRLRLEELPR